MAVARAKKVFVRSAYNYDMEEASLASGTLTGDEPSKAVQSEKDNCDINVIVKRFGITGQLPQNVRMPQYGDFSSVIDYHTAMGALVAAKESFMQLPSAVRYQFHNNPQEFLEFCSEEKDGQLVNIDAMRKMGLAVPKEPVIVPPKAEDIPPIIKAKEPEGKKDGGSEAK